MQQLFTPLLIAVLTLAIALPQAHAEVEAVPTPPSPLTNYDANLRRQAGVGSDIAYARRGVLELGGGMTWVGSNSGVVLAFTPTIGWFFADNFEISGIVQMTYSRVSNNTSENQKSSNVFVTGLLEPSLHIPVLDTLFLFGGLGVGMAYETEHRSVGAALAPRLGVQVAIGRSGILTPSGTWTWSSNPTQTVTMPAQQGGNQDSKQGTFLAVNSTYGANINYTVMW